MGLAGLEAELVGAELELVLGLEDLVGRVAALEFVARLEPAGCYCRLGTGRRLLAFRIVLARLRNPLLRLLSADDLHLFRLESGHLYDFSAGSEHNPVIARLLEFTLNLLCGIFADSARMQLG